ncbi:MAG: CinA family nicotinamide mononucleotide deamidase-related protein [Bacteroidetes bacterium]|nr:CinA family nicotinamide mononucleotide deamidase-related protein [Bacteroidota bacterium]
MDASIITIGDELLIGQTIDTNSAWIARHLNELGINVKRRVAVGDTADAIKAALDNEITESGIILVTGGLGPTSDDITKPLLCEYFGGKMVVNEKVLNHVKDIFTKRNRPFLERNLRQAEVPDNCQVLHNRMGTAPGMMFGKDGKIIVAMPGVPFEMMAIMEDHVLPLLRNKFTGYYIVHRSILTVGQGESFIAEKIVDIEENLPEYIKLAYLPSVGMVKLRLTGSGENETQLIQEIEYWQNTLSERLGNIVLAKEDIPIEQVIGRALLEKGRTVSFAESCTGGYLSHLMTQIPGASNYFKGSVVSYLIEVKENVLGVSYQTLEELGAVSEPVAIQMVEGVRKVLNTDYSLSVTGVLGPGVDDGRNPVGTVWIAVSDGNTTVAKDFRFFYDRIRNKEMTATMAMLMLWKFINNQL